MAHHRILRDGERGEDALGLGAGLGMPCEVQIEQFGRLGRQLAEMPVDDEGVKRGWIHKSMGSGVFRFKTMTHLRDRVMQTRAHGADGNAQGLGDLRVGQPLRETQIEDLALHGIER